MNSAPYPWQLNQWQRLLTQLQDNRLAHAYVLTGDKGLGKHAFANAASQLLLCEQPEGLNACGNCRSCELFVAGSNPDLMIVGPESSQIIKVDQIRELSDFANKTSHGNRRKVIIVDRADALNINAANALLKTLEEPPETTVLLLITAMPGRLLATIRSRCQRILFGTPDAQTALHWLTEQAGNQAALPSLLEYANNRPLLALQMFESEEGEQRDRLAQALTAIVAGKLDPVEFAAHGKNIGADKILEQLWHLTATTIKQFLAANEEDSADQQLALILQELSNSSRSENDLLGRMLAVNHSVDEARKQLASASNPNSQLLLEGILWRWSRLVR